VSNRLGPVSKIGAITVFLIYLLFPPSHIHASGGENDGQRNLKTNSNCLENCVKKKTWLFELLQSAAGQLEQNTVMRAARGNRLQRRRRTREVEENTKQYYRARTNSTIVGTLSPSRRPPTSQSTSLDERTGNCSVCAATVTKLP